jgi:hypothetical protein
MGKWQPAIVKLLGTRAAGQRLDFIKQIRRETELREERR